MEEDLDGIKQGIYEFALPLFEKVDTPEAFIRFLSEDIAPFRAMDHHACLLTALSYLVVGDYEQGKEHLLKIEEILSASWCEGSYVRGISSNLLEKLRAGRYDAVDEQLQEYTRFTREHIGLPQVPLSEA
jgi:hypothetical protein